MAAFSSRGGPGQTLGVSKPDVTAPGVQILAGHTPMPATPLGGPPGQLFQAIDGTSMSSPHVAGAAALLQGLHPDWTPGQIKSALMLTAKVNGVVQGRRRDGRAIRSIAARAASAWTTPTIRVSASATPAPNFVATAGEPVGGQLPESVRAGSSGHRDGAPHGPQRVVDDGCTGTSRSARRRT